MSWRCRQPCRCWASYRAIWLAFFAKGRVSAYGRPPSGVRSSKVWRVRVLCVRSWQIVAKFRAAARVLPTFHGYASYSPSRPDLMHLDDVAVEIIEENLLPASHGPAAVVGIGNAFFLQMSLERGDVVGAEGNVAAFHRIDNIAGPKAGLEIPLGQMHLRHSIGDKGHIYG